jgi:phage terminase large subunit-like protein
MPRRGGATRPAMSETESRTARELRAAELERERRAARWDWHRLARPSQRAPDGNWRIWLVLAGRGFGKTRSGAEWVREQVESARARRIALIGPTAADVRRTMIEGDSGLLAVCPPWQRPAFLTVTLLTMLGWLLVNGRPWT